MNNSSSRATVFFSCLGHLYVHLCTAFFFVIVLALEVDWQIPYHELIELWTLGSFLVGAVALPAGLLSDRVGAPVMMIVFFCGLGLCSIVAGLSDSTSFLLVGLSGIGLFASIYHPVGIPWLVRNAPSGTGKVLGFNGIFGSMGAAVSGIIAGSLIDSVSWRAAFIIPGIAGVCSGLLLAAYVLGGRVEDSSQVEESSNVRRGDRVRVYVVLLITMFLAGLIFNATQTALPKAFSVRVAGLLGEGTFRIGLLVALVYGMAGIMQVVGGHLADRFPLKIVYSGAFLLQVPLLWIASDLTGSPLIVVTTLMVVANVGALPAENMMLAYYTPSGRHGLVFGIKFVVSFGAAPIAVQLVALILGKTGDFFWIFCTLGILAACAFLATLGIPVKKGIEPEG